MSLEWWQKGVMYQVYLTSFKDSNDDGIGDFQGLLSKLDYFKDLKVSTLMLSPFFSSPMKDNGYDVSDHTDINPIYGDMADFEELMQEIKRLDMNVIIDFVPNHTSDQHSWFQKSIDSEAPFTDFYVWVEGKNESVDGKKSPPNNWLSVFGGSAWTWNEKRKKFYLHQFLPEQPDLNLRNPDVRNELKNILQFWLEKGVDGFRIDGASHLFEDVQLRDEPRAEDTDANPDEYKYLDHIYTKGQEENLILIEEWRQLLDEYGINTEKSKILMAEIFEELPDMMRYYGTIEKRCADFPFNFTLYDVKLACTGFDLYKMIDDWLTMMPKGKCPNWVLSNHDHPRVATRVGKVLAGSLQMVTMLLPGIPFCYYGDELLMRNGTVSPDKIRDTFALRTCPENSRDPMRTPMQWTDEGNAGFTNADKPWLPVGDDYKTVNVKVQNGDPSSPLQMFKHLIKLKREPSVLFGTIEYPMITEQIFSFFRFLIGTNCYLLVLNMSSGPVRADLSGSSPYLPDIASVEITNSSFYSRCLNMDGLDEVDMLRISSRARSTQSASTSAQSASTSAQSASTSVQSAFSADFGEHRALVALNDIRLEPKAAVVLCFKGAI